MPQDKLIKYIWHTGCGYSSTIKRKIEKIYLCYVKERETRSIVTKINCLLAKPSKQVTFLNSLENLIDMLLTKRWAACQNWKNCSVGIGKQAVEAYLWNETIHKHCLPFTALSWQQAFVIFLTAKFLHIEVSNAIDTCVCLNQWHSVSNNWYTTSPHMFYQFVPH